MSAYILRRLLQSALVLLALSFVSFGIMGLMPGDPLDIACAANPHCTTENLDQMKRSLGLDRPVHERYLVWLRSALTGDLGYSRTYRRPVTEILLPRLGNTMLLGFFVLILSLAVAIPLGVFSSLRPNSRLDYVLNLFVFAGISAPSFWLGLMLMLLFSVQLNWLPAGGTETVGAAAGGFFAQALDRARYLVMPVLALSLMTIAGWMRYTRASMMETLRHDYIRTARAKGLPPSRVITAHALRNALIPVVTVVALSLPSLVSGALITEMVFAYQGVGRLMYDSIIGNDFNVAMCSFVITCVTVLAMNLIADVVYAWLDPRIVLR